MKAQAAKLIGDGTWRDRLRIASRGDGEMLAQIGATEAVGEKPERDEGMQERLDARIGETEARGALAARRDRAVDGLEGVFGKHAVVAQALHVEQPSIGRKADRAQL